jgi:ornithine carbamoyltransferase
MNHFLTLNSLDTKNLLNLVETGYQLTLSGIPKSMQLIGKYIGIYFRAPSTRTRTAFNVAAQRLGASVINYGPQDLQLVTGETVNDTAIILSQFLDALVMRTNGDDEELEQFSRQNKMPIVNALTKGEHPTQAITDLITIRETFGALKGIHVLYLGEANNTAIALARAISRVPGMRLTMRTPLGYGMTDDIQQNILSTCRETGAEIQFANNMLNIPNDIDVIYTTRWESMGATHADENWLDSFLPFRVSNDLLQKIDCKKTVKFMHDLPATRNQEICNSLLDGPNSIVLRQAFHKLTGAIVVLSHSLNTIV